MCVCVCVCVCMFTCIALSGAEGSCGLVVRHTLGFDPFSVVIIHHLVGDFCQNTLSQRSWRGLETQRQTRQTERRREVTNTHNHQPAWFKDARIYFWARCCQRSRPVRLMQSDVWKPLSFSAFTFCPLIPSSRRNHIKSSHNKQYLHYAK